METIWLQRPSGDIPWGFRLQGGREFAQPLSVQRVTPGSVAANSNSLAPGDLVLKIGNVNATNITHNEAQEVICGATNILQLTIKKGPGISAPMSPTPLGSGQFSSPLEQHDKYSTLPDYRIGTGYQALNNASSGYINAQESSAYDMRQLEQTPPMSGYSTMPVRGSANKQNTDGFRPVQQSQQNKYPYKSTSGIQLQLNPQTQSNIRNDNSYNQRGDYNDGGSYSQPMSPVQYTNGNRTESPYQRQTSVGSNRQDPYSGHPQSYFKKPTPFSPGYADNYTDNSPQPPRAQRQTSSGSQPGNVYDATISPGFQSRSYISEEPPPTPPPPVNYQPEPYSRPYEPDFDRPTYQRQPSNPQSASYNYNSSPYEQSQNDYNAYQSRQNRDVYVDTSDNQYQRQGSRPYEPQPPLQPPYQRPSNPSYYDDRGSAPMTPTRLQGQPSFGSSTQYGSPDPYASPQHFSRQSSRDQQQQSQPQYSRQSSTNQSQPLSRQFSREQHSDLPTYTNPISPPGNTINSFEDILSPFENFQNSNYCDKLFSRSPDARGGDPDSGVSMSSDTPRSNQSSTYSPPHSYPGAYDRGQGLLRPAHQAPPPPPGHASTSSSTPSSVRLGITEATSKTPA
ncbi:hypothetical protein DPMN_024819 [Dreissena polymorpha]|uniref:PDZ domain-containing protein n=1 Tax=Dreissena polymorpha TaxID=45954 RepID=A0A9D4LS34_DREPO|nr:hypothetical protein DPMN_024819 [Dreissena polymorpha]